MSVKRKYTTTVIERLALKYLIMAAFLGFRLFSFAQIQPLYSSYLFNGLSINPAYAGYRECLNANLWAKRQWQGIAGAPTSFLLSVHTPLPKQKIALGLNIYNDSWGPYRQSGISGIYAYRIKLSEKYNLATGLQAGLINTAIDLSSVSIKNPGDPAFSQNRSTFQPDFGTGLFISSSSFFIGISAAHLQRCFIRPTNLNQLVRYQYLLTTGYLFTLSNDLKLKPSVLIRATEGSNINADLNLNLLLREVLWVGASYRTLSGFVFLTQMKLSPELDFGYAMDLYSNMSSQRKFISHEVMLNYRFHFRETGIITPRYF